jgi:hypothetical protein
VFRFRGSTPGFSAHCCVFRAGHGDTYPACMAAILAAMCIDATLALNGNG